MSAAVHNSPTITNVYSAIDPTQTVLRSRLDTLSEDELVALDTDLGYHARTGALTSRIRTILAALEDVAPARAA